MFASDILDTLRIESSKIWLKEYHIQRTFEASEFLKHKISHADFANIYNEIENSYTSEIIRIIFSKHNPLDYKIEKVNLDPVTVPAKLKITQEDMIPSEYKWSDRESWKNLLKNLDSDDILLITPQGFVRETSRFNVFLFDPSTKTYSTPELNTGCINGVYRRYVLKEKISGQTVIEKNIHLSELSNYKIFVGNSVRGLLSASV